MLSEGLETAGKGGRACATQVTVFGGMACGSPGMRLPPSISACQAWALGALAGQADAALRVGGQGGGAVRGVA